jgi:D-glycero-D-manno-heptose 1,7-bisphosphate phosphatase
VSAASRRAAFIDRDGVINVDLHHVGRPEDFHLLPSAVEGLRRLAADGYALVVVTNQAGIAKGLYDEAAYQHLTAYMTALLQAQGVELAGVYHCPHHPQGTVSRYAVACDCRKPAPGMLRRAAADLDLDLAASVLVGDKTSDTEAGRAAGVRRTVLVASGHALPDDARNHADQVCPDLAAAAHWIADRTLNVNDLPEK